MRRRLRALVTASALALTLTLATAAVLLTAGPAAAAGLTQVSNFGTNPTGLNMFLYVPATVAPRPALLVLVHYCSGSANAIFNGNGRDYVTAADRYGYIMVVPETTPNGRCFDVSTAAALRRNGGGDSTGVMSMVSYVRARHNVDPARIVVSGFSSGAMMTNVLAAQYPDVFTAGSAFSGVPAGCFATTNGSTWNSQCSGGNLIKTAQQWGDQARAMYPGYTGSRPRMQFLHGTTDTTLAYPNFGEQIKQWTNLHGVSQTPAHTDRPQSNWTRTRYGSNTGTQATVEGISISGVGHQLPQAGQIAYAIPFLGLDRVSTPQSSAPPSSAPPSSAPPSSAPPSSAPPSSAAPSSAAPSSAAPSSAAPPSSSDPGSRTCRVTDTISAWSTGLTSSITITNTGATAINGWSLAFQLPGGQTITGGWSATYSPSTGLVTATNASYNGALAPGASTTIGFQATHGGNAAAPTAFTLNGTPCAVA